MATEVGLPQPSTGIDGPPRRCKTCLEIKPLAEYYTNRTSKEGVALHCKICYCKRQKERREIKKAKTAAEIEALKHAAGVALPDPGHHSPPKEPIATIVRQDLDRYKTDVAKSMNYLDVRITQLEVLLKHLAPLVQLDTHAIENLAEVATAGSDEDESPGEPKVLPVPKE